MLVLVLMVLDCVFVTSFQRSAAPRREHRDVQTLQGLVRGYRVAEPPHFAFFGIPYARAPTRDTRFKAPEPPPRWDGIFEATYRVRCPQPGGGGENCLVLNVFAPEGAESLSVMVHIHDGGFHSGWGSHEAPAQLIERRIVVVTFNYRLGPFGFLCLGTTDAPGNAGLKDQVAAIYWIHRNIASFGGNPLDVTLYGTGSGAASIQFLLFSGMTKTLFHKVILESGSAISPAAMNYDSWFVSRESAKILGFTDIGSSSELEKFYKKIPTSRLQNLTSDFLPCVEKRSYSFTSLIDQDPRETLVKAYFHDLPMLFAFTENDGQIYIDSWDRVPKNFDNLLPNNLEFSDLILRQQVAELTKSFYFKKDDDENVANNFANYFTDTVVQYPMMKSAAVHAIKGASPVYVMVLSHKFNYIGNKDKEMSDAKHGDIFRHIFHKRSGYYDAAVGEKLAILWSNFIKFGDPTPLKTSLVPVIWEPIRPHGVDPERDLIGINYLKFGHKLEMHRPAVNDRMAFWERIYSKFYKKHTAVFEEILIE